MAVFAVLASAQTAQTLAAVVSWDLEIAPTTNDWFTGSNWNGGAVPGAADHVIIHNGSAAANPVISGGAAPDVAILTPSWHPSQITSIDITAVSSIAATNFARLSGGDNSTSTVTFHPGAGVSVWHILQMSFDTNGNGALGDSMININGGILHVGTLGFSNDGTNTTNIDLEGTGLLTINGDHTAKPWVTNGWITANDGTGIVDVTYNVATSRTDFTVSTLLLGDFDGDGDVDEDDLTVPALGWNTRFGIDLDGSDFLDCQRNFAPPSLLFGAVPEPTSLALLTLASFGCLATRRK